MENGNNVQARPPRPDRPLTRIRHELRLRRLQVQRSERINPYLIRITLSGDDLAGFASPGFDDHIKLFFPETPDGEVILPSLGPQGAVFPVDAPPPASRHYTPRRYDAAANILEIDFALHQAGPATAWAMQAQAGQQIGVGGPRMSLLIPTDFDWHLLIGDDTALPAIARRLAELPPGSQARVLAEVEDGDGEQVFDSRARLSTTWVHRRGRPATSAPLQQALRELEFPDGDYYAWIACESATAKALRAQLLEERGTPAQRIRAAGYWRHGEPGAHDRHGE